MENGEWPTIYCRLLSLSKSRRYFCASSSATISQDCKLGCLLDSCAISRFCIEILGPAELLGPDGNYRAAEGNYPARERRIALHQGRLIGELISDKAEIMELGQCFTREELAIPSSTSYRTRFLAEFDPGTPGGSSPPRGDWGVIWELEVIVGTRGTPLQSLGSIGGV